MTDLAVDIPAGWAEIGYSRSVLEMMRAKKYLISLEPPVGFQPTTC
jgi:hypothetical protein